MPSDHRHQTGHGIAFVIGAASCFATMDTTIRYIGAYFSVALVLWARYGLHAVIMTLWITLSTKGSFRGVNPMFQIARGALLAFASSMAFAALRRMPVAALAGYLMFGLAPDGWSWLGMAIIGICGAASAWLNVHAAAERQRPVSAVQVDTVGD